ncbi:DUF1990 domain-containing protein [Deinococcus irradiatisoli]|uniref:DUF1990 domain-containing protein n=1 Tax=Deinococcus irradiatisoli TaxID=2202254 RepID=A0A2Z3JHR9_9DEIO|nr:DUF1990 domain-containing protein [Deinococcus irradiatisoli]
MERLEFEALTYRPAGLTLREHERGLEQHRVVLGAGPATFGRAKLALRGWATHQSRWLRVFPDHQPPAEGQTVLVLLRGLGLCLSFGCRVVKVIDEPRRSGFAYGSLPGHPERGEELFLIEWHADDRVTFTLRALSRPATRLYRLGRPFGRLMRALGTRQYLQAMRRASAGTIQSR